MINDDLIKCPMCGGFTHIANPQLLAALKDASIRKQIEKYVAELVNAPQEELASVGAGKPEVRDFQKDVHNWNPFVPMWRRSPKE
ncbi:MAG TPA: hypothetical protein VKR60_03715 [Candidatus Sulfotelmatobacter sp.]|nr:hypothetical protein [Candidatus Sulfotelmatobacter sp.]